MQYTEEWCERAGKHKFATKNLLNRALESLKKRKIFSGTLYSYKCPFCGTFHFTKQPPHKK